MLKYFPVPWNQCLSDSCWTWRNVPSILRRVCTGPHRPSHFREKRAGQSWLPLELLRICSRRWSSLGWRWGYEWQWASDRVVVLQKTFFMLFLRVLIGDGCVIGWEITHIVLWMVWKDGLVKVFGYMGQSLDPNVFFLKWNGIWLRKRYFCKNKFSRIPNVHRSPQETQAAWCHQQSVMKLQIKTRIDHCKLWKYFHTKKKRS